MDNNIKNTYTATQSDAKKEGIAEGRAEEILRIAKELKKDKMPVELIIKYTNLSMEEIQKL